MFRMFNVIPWTHDFFIYFYLYICLFIFFFFLGGGGGGGGWSLSVCNIAIKTNECIFIKFQRHKTGYNLEDIRDVTFNPLDPG